MNARGLFRRFLRMPPLYSGRVVIVVRGAGRGDARVVHRLNELSAYASRHSIVKDVEVFSDRTEILIKVGSARTDFKRRWREHGPVLKLIACLACRGRKVTCFSG